MHVDDHVHYRHANFRLNRQEERKVVCQNSKCCLLPFITKIINLWPSSPKFITSIIINKGPALRPLCGEFSPQFGGSPLVFEKVSKVEGAFPLDFIMDVQKMCPNWLKMCILQLLCHFSRSINKTFSHFRKYILVFHVSYTLGRCRIRFSNSEMW